MRMTCGSHTNPDSDSRVYEKSMIPIPIPIPVASDSNSDSNSSVSQKPWFRFSFRFQHHMIPIPIPIPTNQALIPILIPESDSNSGIIYNSGLNEPKLSTQVTFQLVVEKWVLLFYSNMYNSVPRSKNEPTTTLPIK